MMMVGGEIAGSYLFNIAYYSIVTEQTFGDLMKISVVFICYMNPQAENTVLKYSRNSYKCSCFYSQRNLFFIP